MYGVEANSTGRGGLAAQAAGGDRFFSSVLGIRPMASAVLGGPPQSGVLLPFTGDNMLQSPATIGSGGSAVEQPVSRQQSHWSAVLDFHNSTAPWILIGILILYGWIHLSVRARGGRAHASLGF